MPFTSKTSGHTDRTPQSTIRKSILRHPEVSSKTSNGVARVEIDREFEFSREAIFCQDDPHSTVHSRIFHEPNKITSKLNFPPNQQIFKNLQKLEESQIFTLVQKSANKVADNASKRKSLEIREEIGSLVNSLIELEYKTKEETAQKAHHSSSETDFLGFPKLSLTFQLPSKRLETQRFIESIDNEIYSNSFMSDDYLDARKWNLAKNNRDPGLSSAKNCKCLDEFYDQHSTCK